MNQTNAENIMLLSTNLTDFINDVTQILGDLNITGIFQNGTFNSGNDQVYNNLHFCTTTKHVVSFESLLF